MKTPKTDSMMQASGNMKANRVVVPVAFARELESELYEAIAESERRRKDILRWVHRYESLKRESMNKA